MNKSGRLSLILGLGMIALASAGAAEARSQYVPPAPGADGYVTPTDPTRTEYSNRATATTEGIAAPENQDTFAYPQGQCWVVPNRDNPEGTAIFVPYKHAAEWTQFKANTPFGQPRICQSGWQTSNWSTCSASCEGQMTRTVTCIDEDGKVAPDSECAGARPAQVASCGGTCTPPPPPPTGTISNSCKVKVQYDYTGGDQYYVVGNDCNGGIGVRLWGAGGGGGIPVAGSGDYSFGGSGAFVEAVLPVSAGTRLKVIVGRGGCSLNTGQANYNQAHCGYGGGGAGIFGTAYYAGASGWGGGMAAVVNADTGEYLAIAGGGGGGPVTQVRYYDGGQGGAPNGSNANPDSIRAPNGQTAPAGGRGGTTTGGGAGGSTWSGCGNYRGMGFMSEAGGLYTGGNAGGDDANQANYAFGGGGGAGLYGGGGGQGCMSNAATNQSLGGGGGSSLVPTAGSAVVGVRGSPGGADTSKGWSPGIGVGGRGAEEGGNARVLFFGAEGVTIPPPPTGYQCSTGYTSPSAQNYPINNPSGPNYSVQVDPDARYQNKRWVGSNTTVHPNENVSAGLVPHCTPSQLAEINNPSNWPGGAAIGNFIKADFSGGGGSASSAYSYEYNWQMWPVCSAAAPTTCWSQGSETPNWTGDDSAKGVWDCAYGQPVYYPPAPIGGGGAWQETCYYGFGPNETKFLPGMVLGGANNAACSALSCLEPEQIYYSQSLSGSSQTNPVINGR